MYIKIGNSWVFNADHIKCFGLSSDGKDIIVEYAEGGSDTVEIGSTKEARKIFDDIIDAIGALPYRPMTKPLPLIEGVPYISDNEISTSKTKYDEMASTSQMIEAFTNTLKEINR